MPRQPRIQFEGACYHIFSRGNRKEKIFHEDWDYARFEQMMLETAEQCRINLFNWSQMPNHFHQALETPNGNIAEYMSRLLTRYSMYFNRTYQTVGHVFQGRYGAKICEKESYFMELIRYIQLNPYKVKTGPLANLGDWKWASHRYMMMPESQWPAAAREGFREVLQRFGDTPTRARENYAKFLADGLREGNWEDFYQLKEGLVLGSEAFAGKVLHHAKTNNTDRQFKMMAPKTIPVFISSVTALSGYSEDQLRCSSQIPALQRWRKALLYVGRVLYRFPVNDLARSIGKSDKAASMTLQRILRSSEQSNAHEIQALQKYT